MIDDETKQILNDLASDQPTRSTPTVSPTYQPTYQQRPAAVAPTSVAPTYVPPASSGNNPTASTPAATTAPGAATSTAPASIDFGNGYSLDREKLRKIKEALLNPNKTP
jgi:hypothetical protein